MRVNANAARCRPSLGVNILVSEGGIDPRPASTYHQRLEVVRASKADRDRTVHTENLVRAGMSSEIS
jgi:hypothetical protein